MELRHLAPPSLIRRPTWQDVGEVRVGSWLRPWDRREQLDVGLIGVPFSRASIIPSSADAGPNAVRSALASFTTFSPDYEVDISSLVVRDIGDVQTALLDVPRALEEIEEAFTDLFRAASFLPVSLGGDHAITLPIVKALHLAHPDLRIGIIQFDAHYDFRVLDHGPSHGTPFRSILEGEMGVQGRNLVQIGISGFSNARTYYDYAREQGVRVISAREVRRRDIQDVMREATERAGNGTDLIYVSVDIDALAASFGPGTGVPAVAGLDVYDLMEALYVLGQTSSVQALDIVELDPSRDLREITAKTVGSAILSFLAGYVQR